MSNPAFEALEGRVEGFEAAVASIAETVTTGIAGLQSEAGEIRAALEALRPEDPNEPPGEPPPGGGIPIFRPMPPPILAPNARRITEFRTGKKTWFQAGRDLVGSLNGNKIADGSHRDTVGFLESRTYPMAGDGTALLRGKSGIHLIGESSRTTQIEAQGDNYAAIFGWMNRGDDFHNPRPKIQFIHGGSMRHMTGLRSKGHGILINRPTGENFELIDMGILGAVLDGLRVEGNGKWSTPMFLTGPFKIFACRRALSIAGPLRTYAHIGPISGDAHDEAFLHFAGGGAIVQLGGKTECPYSKQVRRVIHVENWREGVLEIWPVNVLFRTRKKGEKDRSDGQDAIVRIDGFDPTRAGIVIHGLRGVNQHLAGDYKGLVVNGKQVLDFGQVWNRPILLGTAQDTPIDYWERMTAAFQVQSLPEDQAA